MGRSLIVEADGGSRGNPGVAGYGSLVLDADGGRLLAERAAPLGKESNNVAEYTGLIEGLRAAAAIDPGADVHVRMDSKLVIEQMAGRWKIKHESMKRLALEAQGLVREIVAAGGSVDYEWIPRAENLAADRLSNVGMDGETVVRDLWRDEPSDARLDPESPQALGEAGESDEAQTGRDEASESAEKPSAPTTSGRNRIVLVRHGETEFTATGRLDGRGGSDPDLTERGRGQAANAARLVSHLCAGLDARVVTSTLARAVQTGEPIGEALGVEPEADAGWDEQSYGDWDGASFRDLIRDEPDAFRALRDDPEQAPPGGESYAAMRVRVLESYERLVAGGGTTVVVCHHRPIMAVLCEVLGMAPDMAWRLAIAPGSLTAVEITDQRGPSVVFTNRT
ncbi:bifunctional RNase H/acid phosphatase [Actinomycetota bacterium]